MCDLNDYMTVGNGREVNWRGNRNSPRMMWRGPIHVCLSPQYRLESANHKISATATKTWRNAEKFERYPHQKHNSNQQSLHVEDNTRTPQYSCWYTPSGHML